MSASRLSALLSKEFADLARNRAALFPVLIVLVVMVVLPFGVVILTPEFSGRPLLGGDRALGRIAEGQGFVLSEELSQEGAVQAFLFQQLLLPLLMVPITAAMTFAAHGVIGEKQARTLEPLLATPLTTGELVLGKTLAAFLPALVLTLLAAGLYMAGVALLAADGVLRALLDTKTLLLLFVLGPLAALVALQIPVIVSSRVNDTRTAQQFGVFIILPLVALMVGQINGFLRLTASAVLAVGAGLAVVAVILHLLAIAVFDRESILTRWK